MNTVESYITQLLFEHDCVIVPDLGGFFTVRTEAGYEPEAHKFKAPGKRSAFNPALTHNDGLLIGSIAKQSGKTYDEAKAHVAQFTRNVQNALNSGAGVSLSGLGTLAKNSGAKIIFTPDESINFDTSSYALTSFHAVPATKKDAPEKQPAGVDQPQQKNQLYSEPESKEKTDSKKRILAAAATILILIAGSYLGWLIAFTGFMNPAQNFAAADLNPFAEKVCDLYSPRKEIPLFLQSELGSYQNPLQIKHDYAQLFLTADAKEFIPVKITQRPSGTGSVKANTYYIMAGAFKSKNNADQFVNKLNQNGYSGIILDQKNSLYRVASAQAQSRKQAEKLLAEIRNNVNSGAWILSK